MLGGDQMTAARIRGSKRVVSNSQCGTDCLDGFVPVVEDWHTKMCLLEVFCAHMKQLHVYLFPIYMHSGVLETYVLYLLNDGLRHFVPTT